MARKDPKVEQGETKRKVKENLERIERHYGQVPFISSTIAERPELFLSYADLTRQLLFEPKHLDNKTMELAALAAGTALGADHCLDVHLRQASKDGASDEEIFEAIMVGSVMAMTSCQASALRRFKDFQDNRP
jgi:4-carboxymuconolactone decarboxylase